MSGETTYKSIYGGKHLLEFSESSHRYKVDGVFTPGVTSILEAVGGKNDALLQWASTKALEAYIDLGWERDKAKYAHRTLKEEAADIGKEVHGWIEAYLKTSGIHHPYSKEAENSIQGFLRWWKELKTSDVQTERIVYSERYRYCGTVDLVMNLETPYGVKRVVADFKTGKPDAEYRKTKANPTGYTGRARPYSKHLYQCALYDQAISEEDGLHADAYAVMYLKKEGGMNWFINYNAASIRENARRIVEFAQFEKSELKDALEYSTFEEI